MSSQTSAYAIHSDSLPTEEKKVRRAAQGKDADILTDIYLEDVNIAIWERELSKTLKLSVNRFLHADPHFRASMTVSPESALSSISDSLGDSSLLELAENITELVDMFCCLFELKRVGLRLTALERAMCPKFHVDKVPCRLITTYEGIATDWLPQHSANREKLGPGSEGESDEKSGLYQNKSDIQRLNYGEVALLKGERWEGNENAGLIHRSPALTSGKRRLLLTLDFNQ